MPDATQIDFKLKPGDSVEEQVAVIAAALIARKRKQLAARKPAAPFSAWKLQGRLALMRNLPR